MNSHYYRNVPPLQTTPGISQVRSANLYRFGELVGRLGGRPESFLERHGIDPRVTAGAEHYIDCQAVVGVLEDCAATFAQPLFGIRLAQLQEPDVYGCIATLCRSAPTLREAIRCLVEYIPALHSSESILEMVEGKTVAEFRWSMHSDLGVNDQANCHGLLLNLKMLRMLAGEGMAPSYVTLPGEVFRKTPGDMAALLGSPVRAGRSTIGIAFPVAALDMPLYSANPSLFQVLRDYVASATAASKPDLVHQVSKHIHEMLQAGPPSIEICAQQLGVSARTLQARLKGEGSSFSELLEKERLNRARDMLVNSTRPVADIADLLGYGEHTSFGRAFKRWTGQSPRQFRDGGGR